jgi:hypothetical protein
MAYGQELYSVSEVVASTKGPIIQYRLVSLAAKGIQHTTNLLAKALGVAQQPGTTNPATMVNVRVFGMTKVEVSSAAVAKGAYLSASSGAASTATRKGGTVKTSTAPKTSYVVGIAETSAAAGTGRRLISMILTHSGAATTA